ncbi:M23 family metallopeptidase [Candidatus Woesebacteria bacterium]|nr:M23 family metallopeptidase [Candidatus Woesebacteria bacterium]
MLQLPEKPALIADAQQFSVFLVWYFRNRSYQWFRRFEVAKDAIVDLLYQKRGRYVRPFLHVGTIVLIFLFIIAGPVIFSRDEEKTTAESGILASTAFGSSIYTQQADEVREFRGGEIITHVVSPGETISSIALRYGLQPTTILWENKLTEKSSLKPGAELKILPVDGVRHQVQRGETIFTIAKKYGLEGSQSQAIVDYPFNEFLNDETFELATGQYVVIPDGVMPEGYGLPPVLKTTPQTRITVAPGSVNATGSFIWPTAGIITQGYRFYHKAFDIANHGGGPILASDSGVVVGAGWDSSGYGNRILVDHGNGYITLYGHLSVLQVTAGQRVNRGEVMGQMGSTGHSTGTHLHFEIRQGGLLLNPGDFLK